MPLFTLSRGTLDAVDQTNFDTEKKLQKLIEGNLQTVFGCRVVASEFSTGTQHAGRIDTLALSEDENPVIIEYKKIESSDLINQSLFYLAWIQDHKGDFEIAAQKALGAEVTVDWSDIRVLCIAPNFKKYDLHAVQVMGANLELWTYRLFANNCLYLEEVFQKSYTAPGLPTGANKELTAGQKAALTRKTGSYTFEEHLTGRPEKIRDLARSVQEFILGLDPAVEEVPKKYYVAYKISQNIACMEVQKRKVLVFVKLDPKSVDAVSSITRDVSNIGHYGTGDLELGLKSQDDFERTKHLLEQAYRKVGG